MGNKHKEFEPFEKVLVRNLKDSAWLCDLYCYYHEHSKCHVTMSKGIFSENNIVAYNGNEHLLGTINKPEEIVDLRGEYIIAFNTLKDINKDNSNGILCKYRYIIGDGFSVPGEQFSYSYCIKLSDFNPNDIEETRKHILHIKNGNIVKYKK